MAPGATRSHGAGSRATEEEPDEFRTCFERDRDRILHSSAFRRLAGKTQVFIFPDDHMRTRLTHALEVSQVATGIARPLGLNVALTEAIALGHDCGHGPGGHASEEALDPFVEGGFDHAVWGADVSLRPLNLCAETLDGIRNHSWARPAPATPEGEIVSWADRIAYVCHDFEDAVSAGLVGPDELPALVRERCGIRRSDQLGAFINSMIRTGQTPASSAWSSLRARRSPPFALSTTTLSICVTHLASRPRRSWGCCVPSLSTSALTQHSSPTSPNARTERVPDQALHDAVEYVAGMTDRYACRSALTHLDWPVDQLPNGIDR